MTEPRVSDDIDETLEHAADAPVGDPVSDLVDRVAEEFAERCRRGESPSVDEYARRYPEHARKIEELLPSVAMIERLKGQLRATAESAAEPRDPAPERVGEYRIVRELGRGGMGIVYEAFQESLGRHVALKVLPRHGLLDAKRRRRFQREAMAVAQLHHTNIVPIFAAGEYDGLPFYAMQYIRGQGLDRLLEVWRRDGKSRGPEHWRFVARVGIQAAEALQYAHDQGILHRDIKPANVLIDEHEVAWITDFGLAKLAGSVDLTQSGDVVGTLRYLAPEALRGQADCRGDIYSLGLTLYELLTLKLPFGDLSPSELLRCVTEEQPTRPRKLDRTIPLDLETIVLKATAREPGHRYATAGELAEDLRAFLDDRPIHARRASPPERLARWCRRNRLLAGAAAAVAVSLVVALAAATWGYVTATVALDRQRQALQKQDENVSLSLDAFEGLFEQFRDPSDEGPFAMGAPGPGSRPPGPPPGSMEGPGRGGPPPGMPGKMNLSPREFALLEIVLKFYDRFAERNDTNSRLQGEAARAYRKVAAIYRGLGRDREADEIHARAVGRLEALVQLHGEASDYGWELARALAHDGPETIAGFWAPAEPELRRAIAIVERRFESGPDNKREMYAAALARWKTMLASQLDRLGRSREAVAAYRESIAHDEWLAARLRDPSPVLGVLAGRRAALAALLIRLDRKEEARPLIDQAAAEVAEAFGEDEPSLRGPGGVSPRVLDSLSASYRTLGDPAQAESLAALARRIRERGRDGRSGRRGGGPFAPPGKPARGFEGEGPQGPPPDRPDPAP